MCPLYLRAQLPQCIIPATHKEGTEFTPTPGSGPQIASHPMFPPPGFRLYSQQFPSKVGKLCCWGMAPCPWNSAVACSTSCCRCTGCFPTRKMPFTAASPFMLLEATVLCQNARWVLLHSFSAGLAGPCLPQSPTFGWVPVALRCLPFDSHLCAYDLVSPLSHTCQIQFSFWILNFTYSKAERVRRNPPCCLSPQMSIAAEG